MKCIEENMKKGVNKKIIAGIVMSVALGVVAAGLYGIKRKKERRTKTYARRG